MTYLVKRRSSAVDLTFLHLLKIKLDKIVLWKKVIFWEKKFKPVFIFSNIWEKFFGARTKRQFSQRT